MSALLRRLTSKSRNVATVQSDTRTQCNYANNYYGDQVCVAVKPVKPRINFHVGIQI